jgi:pimeloyl-ACP methyl ester carboxylesterase
MIETRKLQTAPGLVFDSLVSGAEGAPLVLMLHGFCVSRYYWNNQIPVLAKAGFYAVAPNQRGYAPEARPDPAVFENYVVENVVNDALDIVKATGYGGKRFHLVGHDWGGSLSWIIADRWPERVASLTMLSRPHPAAFSRAMQLDPEQPNRSRHHKELLDPGAGRGCSRRTANGSVTGWRATACRRRRSTCIFPSSAIRRRWRRRLPGIGRAVPATTRLGRPRCRRCSSGAMPTTQSGG